jgi:threonine aldolase
MMRLVDLRSDTVTLPTSQMRQAMYQAEVGDDVYGEDSTVIQLENLGAEMTGKEAALFVPSGTMGNQLAVMTHCQRGDEVICETDSHIFFYEVAGLAYLAGVQARTLTGNKGILSAEAIEQVIRPSDIHQPRTALICLENTHNRAGGTCYPITDLRAIQRLAQSRAIPIHIDGARLFNAAIAQKKNVKELASYCDTVSLCLSKGLGAPIGSLLLGSKTFIVNARRYRKLLGGGMRQAGIIAAAGLISLTQQVDRLEQDHLNAKQLASALANLGLIIDLDTVQTNIVLFDVSSVGIHAQNMLASLREFGIKANAFGEYKIRFVTHYGITKPDIEYVINVLAKIIKG